MIPLDYVGFFPARDEQFPIIKLCLLAPVGNDKRKLSFVKNEVELWSLTKPSHEYKQIRFLPQWCEKDISKYGYPKIFFPDNSQCT